MITLDKETEQTIKLFDEDEALVISESEYYLELKTELDSILSESKAEIEPINKQIDLLVKAKNSLYASKYKDRITDLNNMIKQQGKIVIGLLGNRSKIELKTAMLQKQSKTYVYVTYPIPLIDEMIGLGPKVISSAIKSYDKDYIQKMYDLGMITRGLNKIKNQFLKVIRFKDI